MCCKKLNLLWCEKRELEIFGLVVDMGADGALGDAVGECMVYVHEGLPTLEVNIFSYIFAENL